MKVMVYPQEDGNFSVLVLASPGKGRPPVLLKGVAREDLGDQVLPVVAAMRLPKGVLVEPA